VTEAADDWGNTFYSEIAWLPRGDAHIPKPRAVASGIRIQPSHEVPSLLRSLTLAVSVTVNCLEVAAVGFIEDFACSAAVLQAAARPALPSGVVAALRQESRNVFMLELNWARAISGTLPLMHASYLVM